MLGAPSDEYVAVIPAETPLAAMHGYLLSAVAPRPIAFASTVDSLGQVNLAPFSYFNVFSTSPPLLIFSPNRSGRSGHNKDTVQNIMATFEVVINIVPYAIVQQMNVASADFAPDVNEFVKAGLTPIDSDIVQPPRVQESPVQLECKVQQVIVLGSGGGSGNLILCEVVKMHIHRSVLDDKGRMDPRKLDLVARMGGNWYTRANGESLFERPKPETASILSFEGLPVRLRHSSVLTGNELGQLAHFSQLPSPAEVAAFHQATKEEWDKPLQSVADFHRAAQHLLQHGHLLQGMLMALIPEFVLTQLPD